MSGFTNNVVHKNDVIYKTSQELTSVYLDKSNEYLFLNELKKVDTNLLVKPIDVTLIDDILISSFPFISTHKNLNNTKLNSSIVEFVADGIVEMRKIKIDGLKKFNHIDYIQWFIKNIKNPIHKNNIDINSFDILDEQEFVLSHNDLVPGNILFDGLNSIKLIDYDFTSNNNPYFDVASFITETLNENNVLIHHFIKICKDKNIFDSLDILNLEIKYQDILWSLWANYMFEVTGEQVFKDICDEKNKRYLNRITYK